MLPVHYKSGVFTEMGKNKSDTFHPSSLVVPVILQNPFFFFNAVQFGQREAKLAWWLKLFNGIRNFQIRAWQPSVFENLA